MIKEFYSILVQSELDIFDLLPLCPNHSLSRVLNDIQLPMDIFRVACKIP